MRTVEEVKKYQKNYYQRNKEYLNARSRKWRTENKEKAKENGRNRRKRIRMEVMSYYGGSPPKCVCCGEQHIEFLTIDHVNGNKLKNFGEGSNLYYWLRKNDFPEGFQVLCFNCNCAKGIYGVCPHEKEKVNEN